MKRTPEPVIGVVRAVGIALALSMSMHVMASPILGSADISLNSTTLTDLGFANPLVDSGVVATSGQEICIPGDSVNTACDAPYAPGQHPPTNIGGDGTGGSTPLLPGEYIDLQTTSIVVSIANGDSASTLSGYAPGSFYGFDDVAFVDSITHAPIAGSITSVGIGLSNVSGVLLGSQVTFGAHSLRLYIDTLEIGTTPGSGETGTVTLTLRFTPTGGGPTPAPEPGSLPLFVVASLALVLARMARGRYAARRRA